MYEVLISATLLICLTLLLRYLTRGKISMKFRYALWGIVAIRLLLPVFFGSSIVSVLNLAPVWTSGGRQVTEEWSIPERGRPADKQDYDTESSGGKEGTQNALQTMAEPKTERKTAAQDYKGKEQDQGGVGPLDMRRIHFLAAILWIFGMAGVGGYMIASQLRLVRYLHRMRTEVLADEWPGIGSHALKETWDIRMKRHRIRVFSVEGLPSPCLVGHDIYMEPRILQDEERLRHVLAHEYAHFIQKDTIWAALRSMLCAVYWFYPLVWMAAYSARRDSELACDERVIELLGEKERFAYGRTLLDLFSGREERIRCTGAVLIMGGRENSVKERILMITAKKKRNRIAAVLVALTAILGCGCAFTGPTADRGASGNKKEILLTNRGDLSFANTDVQEAVREDDAQEEQREGIRQEPEDTDEKEQTEFEKLLFNMEDTALEAAEQVDRGQYYDYIYEKAECPMEDGRWYRLLQEAESGIEFYGLYTEKYGCRGMKIEIDGDVNTFDEPWLPTYFGIKVNILEEAESDGLPRSFAFTECVVNSGTSEIWRLYVADRYDTGTIDLYCFEEEDYRRQIREKGIDFLITDMQGERTVQLMKDGTEEIDRIAIPQFDNDDVEEVVWDDASACFTMEEGHEAVKLATGIGLKLADGNQTRFAGLPLIEFPVDVGSFGEHKFQLRMPNVSETHVSGRLDR